ncbi:MAG: hypothetical protein MI757_20010 [Pirellulales bacterium]|nr:hypothetical protein [Pirellulales bacterium]
MKCGSWLCLFVVFALAPIASAAGPIMEQEKGELDATFKKWWGEEQVWKLDELPIKGYVPLERVPYAGNIYPDNQGGTIAACRKYDYAFNRGRRGAEAHERWDVKAYKTMTPTAAGLFGRRTVMRNRVPHWSGHCNGWTSAAIRHAEPARSVTRNGVTFTPSDIKALLAELYTFTNTENIGGIYEHVINPAALHMTLTNWVGRKRHPIAMENTPGKEIWNFPVYAYNSVVKNYGRTADVKVTMAYKNYTEREFDKAPKNVMHKYFHYQLTLNAKGEITGGSYYGDSSTMDFFWVPSPPVQGGKKGNERGNPYLKMNDVLALWRASVDQDVVNKWVNFENIDRPEVEVEVATPEVETPETDKPEEESPEGAVATTES